MGQDPCARRAGGVGWRKVTILAQAISCSNDLLLTRKWRLYILVLDKTLLHAAQRMERCSKGMVQIVRGRRPKAEQWPLAPGHRQNRARRTSQQRQHQSGSASLKRSSTPKVPQSPVTTAVRERRTPEQVRTDASTRVSRLQAALDTHTDGDMEEMRALQLALAKAQKQAEELPDPGHGCPQRTRRSGWRRWHCKKQ